MDETEGDMISREESQMRTESMGEYEHKVPSTVVLWSWSVDENMEDSSYFPSS